MKSTFLKLDLFKKLPSDLTEPTFCGALGKPLIFATSLVSIACTVLLVLLSMSEFRAYFEPATSSNMLIQTSHASDNFHINIDIEMPRMPCDVISLDVEDSMGYHVVDYYGEMVKTRMSVDG